MATSKNLADQIRRNGNRYVTPDGREHSTRLEAAFHMGHRAGASFVLPCIVRALECAGADSVNIADALTDQGYDDDTTIAWLVEAGHEDIADALTGEDGE